MKKQSVKTGEVKKVRAVNLVALAKQLREAQMKKIASWYDTSGSSCARIRSVGNGL